MKKRVWNVIHESDYDDGTPALWSSVYEDGYLYIEDWNTHFLVTNDYGRVLVSCKSLKSAKAWVTRYIDRRG